MGVGGSFIIIEENATVSSVGLQSQEGDRLQIQEGREKGSLMLVLISTC